MPNKSINVSTVVRKLINACQSILIYPEGHNSVQLAFKEAHETIVELLGNRSKLRIIVHNDYLDIENEKLDSHLPGNKELLRLLRNQNMAEIQFLKGINQKELLMFFRLISESETKSRMKAEQNKLAKAFPHIKFQFEDYAHLKLEVEQKITHRGKNPLTKRETPLHYKKNTYLGPINSIYSIDDFNAGDNSGEATAKKPPTSLKNMVEAYKKEFNEFFNDDVQIKHPSQEHGSKTKFPHNMMEQLGPSMENQLHKFDFDTILQEMASEERDGLPGNLDVGKVIETIKQANDSNSEVSPTFIALVRKMLTAMAWDSYSQEDSHDKSVNEPPSDTLKLGELLKRENYEHFVNKDYDASLKYLTKQSPEAFSKESFPIADYLKTLEENRLTLQIARALLAFIQEEVEIEERRNYISCIVLISKDLISQGEFKMLIDIVRMIDKNCTEATKPEIKKLYSQCKNIFISEQFIEKTLKGFAKNPNGLKQDTCRFLLSFGSAIVPAALEQYNKTTELETMSLLNDILLNFKEDAIIELKHLMSERREILSKNIFSFIQNTGDQTFIPLLRLLLSHYDKNIIDGAFKTLLEFKDTQAIERLIQLIVSKERKVSEKAIELARLLKVKEVVPDLMTTIDRLFLFMAEPWKKKAILKTLGMIGDERTISMLEKIAKKKWTFYPGKLRDLKIVLFHSLDRYPVAQINTLLETGDRLKDERISMAIREIRNREIKA